LLIFSFSNASSLFNGVAYATREENPEIFEMKNDKENEEI